MKLKHIQMEKIRANPNQPRQKFDNERIKELANSVKESELLQPIVVRRTDGNYSIVAGERRFRAYKKLKMKTIPAIIWDIKDNTEALEKSLIENLQREDLTSVERENAITELWESGRYKTHNHLAKKIGLSETRIRNNIKVKEDRERLSAGPAVPTQSIEDTSSLPDSERKEILKRVDRGTLGVRAVRNEVRYRKAKKELAKSGKIDLKDIPLDYRGLKFVNAFTSKINEAVRWVVECNKYPFERALTKSQLNTMLSNLTNLLNEGETLFEKLEREEKKR